jgi:predicted nucleic acid-binding protein
VYCFDTDVLSAVLRRDPPLHLIRRLDEPDLRIGSIALSRGLTLVTGNVRHFSRIPDLSVESWLDH